MEFNESLSMMPCKSQTNGSLTAPRRQKTEFFLLTECSLEAKSNNIAEKAH
jgi:hypothetical protein